MCLDHNYFEFTKELFVVPEPDQIYPLLQVVHACT